MTCVLPNRRYFGSVADKVASEALAASHHVHSHQQAKETRSGLDATGSPRLSRRRNCDTVTCIVFSRQLAADSLANFRRGQLPTLCTFPCICRQPRTPCKEKPARKTELTVKSIKKRGQTWPNEVKFVDRKVFLSTNLTAFFDSQPEIAADSRG